MGKDSDKGLVGQPNFKQIIDFLPRDKFEVLVSNHKSDKSFSSWTQLVTILFGIFSRCGSMGEACDGMRALEGKRVHFKLSRHIATFA